MSKEISLIFKHKPWKFSHTHKHAAIGMNAYPNAMCHKGINVVLRLVTIIKTTPKRKMSTYTDMFTNVSLHSTKLKKKHERSNSKSQALIHIYTLSTKHTCSLYVCPCFCQQKYFFRHVNTCN